MASTEFDRSLDDIIKQNKKGGKNNNSPNKGKQPNAPKKQQQQGNKSPQKNGRKFKLNRNGLYSSQMINSSPKKGQGKCWKSYVPLIVVIVFSYGHCSGRPLFSE